MKQPLIVHSEVAAASTAAAIQSRVCPAVIKLGLDMHLRTYVVVARYDHAARGPQRRVVILRHDDIRAQMHIQPELDHRRADPTLNGGSRWHGRHLGMN